MSRPSLRLLVLAGDEGDFLRPASDQLANAVVKRLEENGEHVDLEMVPLLPATTSDEQAEGDERDQPRTCLLLPEDEFRLKAVEWRRRFEHILTLWKPSSIVFIADWNRTRSPSGLIRVYLREASMRLHFARMGGDVATLGAREAAIEQMSEEIADLVLQDETVSAPKPVIAMAHSGESARPQPTNVATLVRLREQTGVDRVSVKKTTLDSEDLLRASEDISGLVKLSPPITAPCSPLNEKRLASDEKQTMDEAMQAYEKLIARHKDKLTELRLKKLEVDGYIEEGSYELRGPVEARYSRRQRPGIRYVRRRRSPLMKWLMLGASAGLLAALFRHELASLAAPLLKLFSSVTPPAVLPPVATSEDQVELSAFGPPTCAAGERVLIQTVLHIPADQAQALGIAAAADPAAALKVKTVSVPLKAGDEVSVFLEADGCQVDLPAQKIVWQRAPILLQFLVSVPNERRNSILVKVTLVPPGLQPSRIMFRLGISGASPKPPQLLGEDAKVFERAFLSYSKDDRVSVIKTAQALDLFRLKYFLDLISLKPGERQWEHRIFDEIEQADLFVLFWSSAAIKSKWVLAETEYALRFAEKSDRKSPDIRPYMLEKVENIPIGLESINFNDSFLYLIAGAEVEAAKRSAKQGDGERG